MPCALSSLLPFSKHVATVPLPGQGIPLPALSSHRVYGRCPWERSPGIWNRRAGGVGWGCLYQEGTQSWGLLSIIFGVSSKNKNLCVFSQWWRTWTDLESGEDSFWVQASSFSFPSCSWSHICSIYGSAFSTGAIWVTSVMFSNKVSVLLQQEEQKHGPCPNVHKPTIEYIYIEIVNYLGFPGGSDGKESACNARDLGSIPGSGRSPGEGNGYPLQYSCLKNYMDRGAWQATAHGVTVRHDWVNKPKGE